MTGPTAFSKWLKWRRKALDLRQEDVADQIGCSLQMIIKLEAGERRPSRQVAELLGERLGVPPDEREAFVRFARLSTAESAAPRGYPVAKVVQQQIDPNPWRSLHHHQTNLPAETVSLIGREEDVEVVAGLLRREKVRLVTLTGPPGIGKTSLGIAAAYELLREFEDGVYMVSLAPISDPGLVVSTIAGTLGLKETGGALVGTLLRDYLRNKRLLLFLDNFEQVLPAAEQVAELLAACPWLKVLVTSRAALHLRAERQFQVSPLVLPDLKHLPAPRRYPDALLGYSAVELFVERAQAVKTDFSLTEKNALPVASICVRLDGLPLAIELAAARAKLLSPTEIEARLDRNLMLLASGDVDMPPRQRTLRAAIDWSYNLLDAGEQTLLARLGVFVGGLTLPAAEAVCNAGGDLPVAIIEGAASLLDKSLLRQMEAQPGESRYTMLEMIREYALEQLEATDEAGETRRLHAEYYLALAEAGDTQLRGPEQVAWLSRLDAEQDNLRAALTWAGQSNRPEIGLRLAGSLGWYWELRGRSTEGREWVARALSQEGAAKRTRARARALSAAGRLAYSQSDLVEATRLLEEGLAIAREQEDKWLMTVALHNLGNIANDRGELGLAHIYHSEELSLSRELRDDWGHAWALMGLGHTALNQEDYAAARSRFEESLAIRRRMGDRWGIGRSLNELGDTARLQGDYEAARLLYQESLAIHSELGHEGWKTVALYNLGQVELHLSNFERAAELLFVSLGAYNEIGEANGVGMCLIGLGAVAFAQGQRERAAILLGAAEANLEATGYQVSGLDRAATENAVTEARADTALSSMWDLGRTMTMEQAIAYCNEGRSA